ncbi:hypothetical protein GBK04_21955 [Cytophagaceae bacterium SJW1-29]|uniref:Secreted protein n=2 Tax=Salmonirosea aquatica TaxID=2654236 RepID=A0A7C9BU07_9BACT|nr:hypothetical protein [Cytophagaceae bacterium SJW1-29]
MIRKAAFILGVTLLVVLFFSAGTSAQDLDSTHTKELSQRVRIAPESVFESFREAGMKPVNHELTPAEKQKVLHAFALLPPLHQRILNQHLQSISFMDNMPNTALTSPVDSAGGPKMFNITFRAGLLEETISEWATWKETTCFTPAADSSYEVRVEGGTLDAIVYVLMHEATHIVDAVMDITPHPAERNAIVEPTPFTKGIWRKMNVPAEPYLDSLLEQTRFRSGKTVPISLAPEVYQKLAQTPYPSLYAMAAWFEDIAELATIYHLTAKLNQPFYVVVTKDKVEVTRFEPMKNGLVKPRLDQLASFYAR